MLTVDRPSTLIGITELRARSDEILRLARTQRVLIGKRGKPVAVLVPIEEWERQETLLDEFEDLALGHLARDRAREAPVEYVPLETVKKRLGIRR
ncbi:MAG: type II toxin-antitoxin system Phd/YefM family antitoxin [Planctomycetes bacterium]|nr:type II toxin-antitoxin system Phd/YefM family antitoxin [Planctomycetota bacterium]